MKWAVFLGSTSVGGGTNVILEHAAGAVERGEDVTIVTMKPVVREDVAWHSRAGLPAWKTIDEAGKEIYDVVIATWWWLVYDAYRIKGRHYLYFVQSIESRFYRLEERPTRLLAEATYMLPLQIITEAAWIQDYLKARYGKNALLVHNGIRKDIYTPDGECYEPRQEGKLRVLVEGTVDVHFKNVPKTIRLCQKSMADEIWLMTASDIRSYKGVDRVFSKVPAADTPKIYRSCDVIVKLSYVEGMFGPPLEMFHCGGTAITYDVSGHDEYIVHGVNALVAKKNDDRKVIAYINKLKKEPDYLRQLKAGALRTAQQWIGWEQSSDRFCRAVYQLCAQPSDVTQQMLKRESGFYFKNYLTAEGYRSEIKELLELNLIKRFWLRIKRKVPRRIKVRIKKMLGWE